MKPLLPPAAEGGGQIVGALAVAALVLWSPPPAVAQVTTEVRASAPTAVAVTVYRDDLALITETRRVELPGGPARVVFDGVLDRAIPQSAIVRGLDGERERNFDFDGLTPMSLLWRSIGERVRVARASPGSGATTEEEATVAAAGDGVMLRFADRAEALGCSGLPERLIFSRIPDGLAAKPALSTIVADAPAGSREITLSYLATGVEWETDYVITLDEAGSARVSAWITLKNGGEEGFRDATVGVVAGDLSRTWSPATRLGLQRYATRACWPLGTTSDFPEPPPPPPPPPPPMMMPAPAMMAREVMDAESIVVTAAKAQREELGDYQLYALTERTGVAARQTKQVMFLDKPAVRFDRVLSYRVGRADRASDAQPTTVLLRTRNDDARGLGEPLPRGTARVFAPHGDLGVLYAGEADTRDTAVGLEWELETGRSRDVTVRTVETARATRLLSGDRERITSDVSVEIANAVDAAQTVEIVQRPLGASLRISSASARHMMKDGAPTWTLTVPARSRTTLTYRVRYIEG